MVERELDSLASCLAAEGGAALTLHAVRPGALAAWLAALPESAARFLAAIGFGAKAGELALIPGADGLAAAALGLGEDHSPYVFGDLAWKLPEGSVWRLVPGDYDTATATLGFCLGAYRFTAFKPPRRAPARLIPPAGSEQALATARAVWMVRDLINTPANHLGPEELADAVASLAARHGAVCRLVRGGALEAAYPALAAVGQGSARPPVVAVLRWAGSGTGADSPLVSLCGKGVVFDSGGYDLKPPAAMQRMKKDMGGAATLLGLARMIMSADLPVRLALRVGCVENSVSGAAMRPLDILRTRAGISVEVGDTDAEGRLVLADLLAEAGEEKPDVLIDCATLTGAARAALGPDLPALFCTDEALAADLLAAGKVVHDPLWRLPLWDGYDSWLDSPVAHLNNISGKTYAGAIVGGLFLRRFVVAGLSWAHLDLYAWNDQARPGRPEGGEAQGMRALFVTLAARFRRSGFVQPSE